MEVCGLEREILARMTGLKSVYGMKGVYDLLVDVSFFQLIEAMNYAHDEIGTIGR